MVLLAALGLGWFAGRLALASATGRERAWDAQSGPTARGRIVRTWLICALLLFAIYCCQELFEGFFSPGHPAGLAGVLGQGGWTAAPIALIVGAALAATLRVADRLLERAALRGRSLWSTATNDTAARREPDTIDWRLEPQAGVTAGRAPPRALSPLLI